MSTHNECYNDLHFVSTESIEPHGEFNTNAWNCIFPRSHSALNYSVDASFLSTYHWIIMFYVRFAMNRILLVSHLNKSKWMLGKWGIRLSVGRNEMWCNSTPLHQRNMREIAWSSEQCLQHNMYTTMNWNGLLLSYEVNNEICFFAKLKKICLIDLLCFFISLTLPFSLTHLKFDPIFIYFCACFEIWIHDGFGFHSKVLISLQLCTDCRSMCQLWHEPGWLHLMIIQRSITHFMCTHLHSIPNYYSSFIWRIWCALWDGVHYRLRFLSISIVSLFKQSKGKRTFSEHVLTFVYCKWKSYIYIMSIIVNFSYKIPLQLLYSMAFIPILRWNICSYPIGT